MDPTSSHAQHAGQISITMQECIAHCTGAHSLCLTTIQHCLERGGALAAPAHIRLLLDCADICRTSADFMMRGSPLHIYTCGACAEVCAQCAEACARLAAGDPQMQACADLCRQCAASCRQMAGMAA